MLGGVEVAQACSLNLITYSLCLIKFKDLSHVFEFLVHLHQSGVEGDGKIKEFLSIGQLLPLVFILQILCLILLE